VDSLKDFVSMTISGGRAVTSIVKVKNRVKNQNVKDLISVGKMFYNDKQYEEAIKYYEEAERLDPNNASIFLNFGNILSDLAKIKQDEPLFERAFEKYYKAAQLNPKNTIAFYNWGLAIFDLAQIKRYETLFSVTCDKYDSAIRFVPKNADSFFVWGTVLYELAKTKQDETLYEDAFKKFDVATRLNQNHAEAFHNWGLAIIDLTEITQNESLLNMACEKFDKATQLEPNDANAFCNWGYAILRLAEIKHDKSLFREACKKFDKTTQLNPKDVPAFYNWGYAISSMLATPRYDDFQKTLKTFESTTRRIDNPDIYLVKGEIYFVLGKKKKAKECFEKSKKSILEILTFLDKENREKITIKTRILHSLLDSDNDDGIFFRKTTNNLKQEQKKHLNKYKEIYIRSIFIISLLHVDDENEKCVAYYREKEVAQKLLFESNSTFRLNAIDYSNDPSEGKTLLDFLYGEKIHLTNDKINNEKYEAFASCFIFDFDNLNMFRLYGKSENGKEGTGLSLVFRNTFFSKTAKMVLGSSNVTKRDKLTLFRCIYIDPSPSTYQHIITVGRREEYLFYRDNMEDKFQEYNKKINGIIDSVRKTMKDLQTRVRKLNHTVVGQLLLNLRYLVKHVAFREEQECRIVKIHRINDKEIIIKDDYKHMYLEYLPEVSSHIAKICFGPKAEGIELFQSILKNKNLNIPCEKSKNPLA